ncbi:MAG: Mut7-C RNAse domain-containing protein [Desulfobacterales bacterium]|nr:Mut7-C RNAse domain-containing protein [Desulfobacterales bacterium]
MRFAADRMLGSLARWLRFIGYDTLYFNNLSDDRFLALADEGRILLSRNSRLTGKVAQEKIVFIKDNDPKEQLREVVRLLGLRPQPDMFFTRCSLCNGVLESVEAGDVFGHVPDHVWTAHTRFSRCGTCGKIYWPGTHLTRSRKKIGLLLGV